METRESRGGYRQSLVIRAGIGLILLTIGLVVGFFLPHGARPGTSTPAAPASTKPTDQWYTCGMHPNVLQKGPGNCPICGMKLVPKAPGGAAAETPASSHTITIDPVTVQNMGIRTATVTRGPLVKTIRTVGRVDYNEGLVSFVNLKFAGWIEKLYVNQTGQQVRKGDKLFEIYSPGLYSAQQEYLIALNSVKSMAGSTESARDQARQVLEAARVKLQFFDVSDEQVDALAADGKVRKTMIIHSRVEGIVTEKAVREGAYVETGTRLYTIADLSNVWVYVDIYEYQLPWVKVGQRATMTLPYLPNKAFSGTVVYLYPYLEEQTRVTKVRMEFDNPTRELKPGMFAYVTLVSELRPDALLIPREAYIDTGTRQVAFVDLGNGRFEPRDINVGVETDAGTAEVTAGLSEGEVVVTSGQFLLDAESKLKESLAKMGEPGKGAMAGHAGHGPPEPTRTETAPAPSATEGDFACPMHPREVRSDTPGNCSLCGMKLVPRTSIVKPSDAPENVKNQINYLMEHYLAVASLLAADKTQEIAQNARGLVAASDEIINQLGDPKVTLAPAVSDAVRRINAAAPRLTGEDLQADRAVFAELSRAMQDLIRHARPDKTRWPKLYVMYCDMAKNGWIQETPRIANPYYGSEMLECGEVKEVR